MNFSLLEWGAGCLCEMSGIWEVLAGWIVGAGWLGWIGCLVGYGGEYRTFYFVVHGDCWRHSFFVDQEYSNTRFSDNNCSLTRILSLDRVLLLHAIISQEHDYLFTLC